MGIQACRFDLLICKAMTSQSGFTSQPTTASLLKNRAFAAGTCSLRSRGQMHMYTYVYIYIYIRTHAYIYSTSRSEYVCVVLLAPHSPCNTSIGSQSPLNVLKYYLWPGAHMFVLSSCSSLPPRAAAGHLHRCAPSCSEKFECEPHGMCTHAV